MECASQACARICLRATDRIRGIRSPDIRARGRLNFRRKGLQRGVRIPGARHATDVTFGTYRIYSFVPVCEPGFSSVKNTATPMHQ